MTRLLIVAIAFALAGGSCLYYTWTRRRRKARALFGWLAAPCFIISVLYMWFYIYNVPADTRSLPAIIAFVLLGVHIMITFLLAGFMSRHE